MRKIKSITIFGFRIMFTFSWRYSSITIDPIKISNRKGKVHVTDNKRRTTTTIRKS